MLFTSVISESRKWNSGYYPIDRKSYLCECNPGAEGCLEGVTIPANPNLTVSLESKELSSSAYHRAVTR